MSYRSLCSAGKATCFSNPLTVRHRNAGEGAARAFKPCRASDQSWLRCWVGVRAFRDFVAWVFADSLSRPVYPALPSRSCQIIRHSRSLSPRSMTCRGVEPSNSLFGRCNQEAIAFDLIISASASNKRVTSFNFWALDRCGAMPAFQYEMLRGEAPVTRLSASFDK